MIEGGTGGGLTLTGLHFERRVDFRELIAAVPGYEVRRRFGTCGHEVLFHSKLVARCFKKSEFYDFLAESGVDCAGVLSRKLLPDDVLLVPDRKTLFVIEVKYQQSEGSVDEKLQTCDFKHKQYMRLVAPLGLRVEYVYILNDWFKHPKYRDVLNYIESMDCHYRFNELPLDWLGLPTDGSDGRE